MTHPGPTYPKQAGLYETQFVPVSLLQLLPLLYASVFAAAATFDCVPIFIDPFIPESVHKNVLF